MQVFHEYMREVASNMTNQVPLLGRSKFASDLVVDTQGQQYTIVQAIDLWLLNKYALTQSKCTTTAYREIVTSLHMFLVEQGSGLDCPAADIADHIQTWANLRSDSRKHRGEVSPSTYNQRIAAISSFYQWAIESRIYKGVNPAKGLSRVPVQKYAKARALNPRQIAMQLRDIDRATPRGLRDYTLLQVALNTGRSTQELASLTWNCLHIEDGIVTLTFQRCKGGKTLYDTLDIRLSRALLMYLRTIYGEQLDQLEPHAPIWVSFSDRNCNKGIGSQTIADICKSHLGFSTVHTLRHTFAIAMEQQGAETSTIQERLGNVSASETDKYLASLRKSSYQFCM